MFRLESKILQREFVVHEGTLYASQIRNVLSGQDFVPDGNSVEFLFHFTDGSEFSSKGLKVADSKQENGKLSFKFEETQGITVTMTFWPGDDGSTLKKQISFVQTGDKTIDYILLEHIQRLISEFRPTLKVLNLTDIFPLSVNRFILTLFSSAVNFPARKTLYFTA